MVAAPPPTSPAYRAGAHPDGRLPDGPLSRIPWLVLASYGPATRLAEERPDPVVRVVSEPRRFRDLLLAERPVIVLLAQPPAGPEDLALVAVERRRRPRMRAVHIAPPTPRRCGWPRWYSGSTMR